MSRKRDTSQLVIGAVAVFVLVRLCTLGVGSGGSASEKTDDLPSRLPTSKKKGKASPAIIDVDSPKVRPSTPAERKGYPKKKAGSRSSTPKKKTKTAARSSASTFLVGDDFDVIGTISASPVLEPHHGPTLPAGYNPAKARAQALAIAAHLARRGPRAYSRDELAQWQRWAGINPDGEYAGSTRGALVAFGVVDPPRPYGSPYATLPYHPPGLRP